MLRIRLTLPKSLPAQTYTHQDLIHDALVNAFEQAGASMNDVIGPQAKAWTFAPLGYHRGHTGVAHSLVVSTADPNLARALTRLQADAIVQRRWNTEAFNFSGATLGMEADPFWPGQTQLACLLLSPLVIEDKDTTPQNGNKRWFNDLTNPQLQLSDIINRQLSARAGRPIQLSINPDTLYLRATPKHSVLVNLKVLKNGRKSFVIGMQAPLLLEGSEDDLRFAWYAGIGEKTRSGFGCLGLLEQGVH